ncbi:MAG TPA: metallophosphoesterase [Candidatus Nitrosocosmicus sp.]
MNKISDNTLKKIKLSVVGDTSCSDNAKKTFQNIVNENPDVNLFLGDSSYEDDATCFIDLFKSFNGLKEKTIYSRGNHDDREDQSDIVKEQLERYFEITEWTITKQVENVYIICLNSQDPDFDLRLRDQYYWVKSKLDEAVRLRDNEKKIDWIIVMIHKPLYTLKGQHKPERKARDVYQPLFDQYQVDFVLHGHSHNMQRTLPIKYGGLDNDPVITASGLDFSQDHGQIYIVSGAGGVELSKFTEPINKWTSFAYYEEYGYNILVIQGKKTDVFAKSNDGKVLDQFTVTK